MQFERPLCSVLSCLNSKETTAQPATFYYLPKDQFRASKWKRALNGHVSQDVLLPKVLVCAKHFEKHAFEANDLDLKKSAIPSIFPVVANSEEPPSKMVKFYTVELRKDVPIKEEIVQKATPHLSNIESDLSSIDSDLSSFEDTPGSDSSKSGAEDLLEGHSDKQSENEFLEELKRLENLKKKLIAHENRLVECEKELTDSLRLVQQEIQATELETKLVSDAKLNALKKCLSPAQIRYLIGKEKARWTLDDISMAYTISCMVPHDFYNYMRDELKMPLPSISNISRYYTKFKSDSNQESVDDPDINGK